MVFLVRFLFSWRGGLQNLFDNTADDTQRPSPIYAPCASTTAPDGALDGTAVRMRNPFPSQAEHTRPRPHRCARRCDIRGMIAELRSHFDAGES